MTVRAHGTYSGAQEPGAEWARARRGGRELRQVCPHVAVVCHGLSRTGSSHQREATGSKVHRRVDAVEVFVPASVLARIRDETAHLTRFVRRDIVQTRDYIAPAA